MSINPIKYIRFFIKILKGWQRTKNETHVNFFRQLQEAFTLLRLNQLEPYEYYCLKLYKPNLSLDEKKRYMSMNQHYKVESFLNPRIEAGIINKYNFSVLAGRFEIPVPKVLGLFLPHAGFTPNGDDLKSVDDLKKLLTDPNVNEFVIKPTSSGKSKGVLVGKNNGDGTVHIYTEKDYSIDELYNKLTKTSFNYLTDTTDIYMIEERVKQHKFLDNYSNTSTQTVRTTTLLTSAGDIEIVAFYLKIARSGTYVDNLSIEHNMGVKIDEAGTLGEGKEFYDGIYGYYNVWNSHPDTGYPFVGEKLPFYKESIEIAKKAQSIIPFLRLLSWDIAITDNGPVILEGNYGFGIHFTQSSMCQGLLQDNYIKHIGFLLGK